MPLTHTDFLQVFQRGIKSKDRRGIGIEKECFLYEKSTGRRLVYAQIRQILEDFVESGYAPVFEKEFLIGCKKEGTSLSLEPGGQFEIAAKPHADLHAAFHEIQEYDTQLDVFLEKYNFFKREVGFEPLWRQEDLSWMPKGRYEIMRNYMPLKGNHGLDMMRRTCTLQANLDYTSEENMAQMMLITNALNPLTSGLFAHSELYEGKPSEYKSFRNFVWQDTDPDRCGLLPFAFSSMRFEDYLDYALDVPMYFVYRNGGYINVAGASFRDFMEGKLAGFEGEYPTLDDFNDQLTVAFPEVRLKQFVEIRGIDASPFAFASAALFVGLLYSDKALTHTLNLIAGWTFEKVQEQYIRIPKGGLSTEEKVIAQEIIKIAQEGLLERGLDEGIYLDPLCVQLKNNH